MTPTTYMSQTKGKELKITEMNTVHLQNAVRKVRETGDDAALLEALETELGTRTDRTDIETTTTTTVA